MFLIVLPTIRSILDSCEQKKVANNAGRKATVPPEVLEAKLNQFARKIVVKGILVRPSKTNVYKDIAANFENYSAQATYQYAKRFFSKNIPNLKIETNLVNDDDDDESECDWPPNDRFNLNQKECNRITVDISGMWMFQHEDGRLKPISEWGLKFRQIIFAMTQMPCAWSIERPRMAAREFTVNCHCLEDDCDGKLYAFTENGQSRLIINTTSFNETIRHQKKNQIRGEDRDAIKEMLKKEKAEVVASKLANEYLRIGDIEPPFMPKTSALRKMKNRENNQLTFDTDPVVSLREMKYAEPYQNCIGNIGIDEFECVFYTPYQKELIRIETNRRKIVICYDATGAPVYAPKTSGFDLERGRFKPIFLYVIMLRGKTNENLPVYQVLTQRHDALNIRSMLETWKYKCLGKKHPHEVISDDGAALLLASAKAFANCNDMNEYADKCYDALFLGTLAPATYIRLDRGHMIRIVSKHFSPLDKNKKRFYSRIFGILLLSDDIERSKFIIQQMFIVLLNRYQYDANVIDAITFLRGAIETHDLSNITFDDPEIHNEEVSADSEERVLNQTDKSKFFNWVQAIIKTVKDNQVNDDLNNSIQTAPSNMEANPYYAETTEKDWCLLLSKIHLWSNVMMKSFGSTNSIPTSASSESAFNILKNVLFANEKRLRVDVFVRRYIDFLNGKTLNSIVKKTTDVKVAACQGKSEKDEQQFNTGTYYIY